MNFSLKNIDFSSVKYTQNVDGTISAENLVAISKCDEVNALYPDKFLQRDYLPEIIVPAITPTSGVQQNITAQATAWVAATYPTI